MSSQISAKNVTYGFVALDSARQATTIVNPASTTYIAEGEIVVCTPQGALLDSDSASYTGIKEVQIAMRTNKGIVKSPVFNYNNIEMYKVKGYVTSTMKVAYVGYNGTSGDLENNTFVPGTEYIIKLRKLSINDHCEDSYLVHKSFSTYSGTLTSGESVIARGLVKNGVMNFSDRHGLDNFVVIEMVSSASSTTTSVSMNFTYNSKHVVAASSGHGVVAGDFIRVGSTTTSPVYYVESVNGVNLYLETPYQGDSGAVTPQELSSPTTAHFGIKLTGTMGKIELPKLRYNISDFQVSTLNFEDTDITISTAASIGSGTYYETAQMEYDTADYMGQTSYTDPLMPSRKKYATSGKNYNFIVLKGYDKSAKSSIIAPAESYFTVLVAIPTGCTQGSSAGTSTVGSGVAVALDNWLTANTDIRYSEASNLI